MKSVFVGKFECIKDCHKVQKKLDDYGVKGYVFHVDGYYTLKTYSYPSVEKATPFADLLKTKGFPDVEIR